MKKHIIVFDLDGTLSIVGDRIKYLQQEPKDWDSFFNNCGEDKPNFPAVETFFALWAGFEEYRMKIVTGRSEEVRLITERWLNKNNIFVFDSDIHMRKTGDRRPDTIVKPELIEEFKDEIFMIFDDRTVMVRKWRELGYTCLQVADGDY